MLNQNTKILNHQPYRKNFELTKFLNGSKVFPQTKTFSKLLDVPRTRKKFLLKWKKMLVKLRIL